MRTVTAMIIACSVAVGLEQSSWLRGWGAVWAILDWVFAAFFVTEVLLRLFAAEPRMAFFWVCRVREARNCSRLSLQRLEINHEAFWNVFDLVIVAVSCTSLFAQVMPGGEYLMSARLLRATRVLLLLGMTERLRRIEEHVVAVIPTVFSFILLLSILIYTYAVLGSHLFSDIAGAGFATVERSFMTMFQVLTLDDWSGILHRLDPVHPMMAPIFLGSFIALTAIIMLNVFIAVLTNELHIPLTPEEEEADECDGANPRILAELAALRQQMTALQAALESGAAAPGGEKS